MQALARPKVSTNLLTRPRPEAWLHCPKAVRWIAERDSESNEGAVTLLPTVRIEAD